MGTSVANTRFFVAFFIVLLKLSVKKNPGLGLAVYKKTCVNAG